MLENRCVLGEGLFLDSDGSLWWVDIPKRKLMQLVDNVYTSFELPEIASKVFGVTNNIAVLACESGIAEFDLVTHFWTLVAEAPPISWRGRGRSNDGCVLPDGRFLVGRMDLQPKTLSGDVVVYGKDSREITLKGIAIPNTFVFLPKSNTVLISDSLQKKTYEVIISQEKIQVIGVWHDFSRTLGTPDGGILGVDGCVYIALWDGFGIARLSQDGRLIEVLPVNVQRPTSIQQDANGNSLVYTSASEGLTRSELYRCPRSGYLGQLYLEH